MFMWNRVKRCIIFDIDLLVQHKTVLLPYLSAIKRNKFHTLFYIQYVQTHSHDEK